MPIAVACGCGKQFRVPDEYAGKKIKCTSCGETRLVAAGSNGTPKNGTAQKPTAAAAAATAVVKFQCDQCNQPMQARAEFAGKKTKCPACKAAVTIPGSEEEAEVAEEVEEAEEIEEIEEIEEEAEEIEEVEEEEDRPRSRSKSSKSSKKESSRRARDEEDEEEDEEEEARPKKSKKGKKPSKKKRSGGGLVVGLVIGGLLLLIGGGVFAAVFLMGGSGSTSPTPLPGRVTKENYEQIGVPGKTATRTEVLAFLGPPQKKLEPKAILPGLPIPAESLLWTDGPKNITVHFDGAGQMVGKSWNEEPGGLAKGPGPGTNPKDGGAPGPGTKTRPGRGGGAGAGISYANYKKISVGPDDPPDKVFTRAEVEAILGPPTKSLGPQEIFAGYRSTETLEWSDAKATILVHFVNGKTSGSSYKAK